MKKSKKMAIMLAVSATFLGVLSSPPSGLSRRNM